ncbi:MAG: guanylate kinase [Planctomycetales bacterium]|nr:guanylate kinase [Planctomycetales bacterium]
MGVGKMVIISGPSGAGKTTLVKQLIDQCPLPLVLSVSATTRPPRPGEENGVDYVFLSDDDFQQRRAANEFLECFEVYGRGYWYGTLRETVSSSLQAGKWVVLEIDVQGMQSVIASFPDAISVFVRPQSLVELERRLRGRGTETEETIQRRLEVARHEWQFKDHYRYDVINDTIEATVQRVCELLQAES